jgi:hypothetical protein
MRVDELSLLRGHCKDMVAAERSETNASRIEAQECSVRSKSRSPSRSARSATRLWQPSLTEPSVRPTEFVACSGRPSVGGRLTVCHVQPNPKPSSPARLCGALVGRARKSEVPAVHDARVYLPKQAI